MNICKVSVSCILICIVTTTPATADFADFSSQLQDAPTWTVKFLDSTITASFNSSFEGEPLWRPADGVFSDPAFVGQFGTTGSLLQMLVPENQTLSATRVDFNIDNPLPDTARLIVMDLDGIRERVQVISNDAGIAAPDQYETVENSILGESSLPIWNPATAILESTALKQNDREASVFDIGGLTHVSVILASDEAASSWYAIATAVPEPGGLAACLLACTAWGYLRRR